MTDIQKKAATKLLKSAKKKQQASRAPKLTRAKKLAKDKGVEIRPEEYEGAADLYNTKVYKEWRRYVFKRDKYKCQLCGRSGGKLEAHHIIPKRLDPSMVLDANNGVTLCYDCHRSIVTGREESFIYAFKVIIMMNRTKQ